MSQDFELRNYQQQAIDIIEGSVIMGSTNLILRAPTSWGKSAAISGLCKIYSDKHIVIMVNIEPLIGQISETLTAMDIDHSILKAGRESEFNENATIQIVMSQTYYARADKLSIKADILIIDERHIEYDTQRTTKLIKDLEPEVIIGTTATPWDSNGYKLKDSEIINTYGINELVAEGFLCPIKYYVPQWAEKIDYSKVKRSGSDYSMASLDEIVNTEKHIDMSVKAMNKLKARDKKTLVFCTSIDQCDHIARKLQEDGYQAIAYHSKNSKTQNQRILDSFTDQTPYTGSDDEHDNTDLFNHDEKQKDHASIKCLCSVAKLTTGFSDSSIELGVNLRATKVLSLLHQIVGRLMRIHPNKEFAEFLDLGGCLSLHGFPEDPYDPPVRQLYTEDNKRVMDEALGHLQMEHLGLTIGEEPELITREKYELRIQEIKANSKRLSEMTTKELSSKMELESDPVVIIAILATLFDKIHCGPMKNKWGKTVRGYRAKNDKDVTNFLNGNSIDWMSELWVEQLESQDEYKTRKFLKALRTRSKNLLREKGSIWSIRFFITWLLDQDKDDIVFKPKEADPEDNTVAIVYEGFDITEEDIPFSLIFQASVLSYASYLDLLYI